MDTRIRSHTNVLSNRWQHLGHSSQLLRGILTYIRQISGTLAPAQSLWILHTNWSSHCSCSNSQHTPTKVRTPLMKIKNGPGEVPLTTKYVDTAAEIIISPPPKNSPTLPKGISFRNFNFDLLNWWWRRAIQGHITHTKKGHTVALIALSPQETKEEHAAHSIILSLLCFSSSQNILNNLKVILPSNHCLIIAMAEYDRTFPRRISHSCGHHNWQ